jgi:hypothetical protein
MLAAAVDATAHGRRASSGDLSGLEIPSVSHGEMAVLAAHRSRIMSLADSVTQPDPTLRRLQNYAAIQYSYCLWGALPGTISDEESPFNECAHAYLAASKALLLHMRTLPADGEPASMLTSEISMEMAHKGAAFIGCEYSGESFNTAEYITPHWEKLPTHLPTLGSIGGIFALMVGALATRLSLGRTSPPATPTNPDSSARQTGG